MKKIVEILARRDGVSEREARELVEETKAEILAAVACGDYELAEDLLMGDLGLEPDYLMDLLL